MGVVPRKIQATVTSVGRKSENQIQNKEEDDGYAGGSRTKVPAKAQQVYKLDQQAEQPSSTHYSLPPMKQAFVRRGIISQQRVRARTGQLESKRPSVGVSGPGLDNVNKISLNNQAKLEEDLSYGPQRQNNPASQSKPNATRQSLGTQNIKHAKTGGRQAQRTSSSMTRAIATGQRPRGKQQTDYHYNTYYTNITSNLANDEVQIQSELIDGAPGHQQEGASAAADVEERQTVNTSKLQIQCHHLEELMIGDDQRSFPHKSTETAQLPTKNLSAKHSTIHAIKAAPPTHSLSPGAGGSSGQQFNVKITSSKGPTSLAATGATAQPRSQAKSTIHSRDSVKKSARNGVAPFCGEEGIKPTPSKEQSSNLHDLTFGMARRDNRLPFLAAQQGASIISSTLPRELSQSSEELGSGLQRYYSILRKQHDCLDISKKFEDGLTTFSIEPQEPGVLIANAKPLLDPARAARKAKHPKILKVHGQKDNTIAAQGGMRDALEVSPRSRGYSRGDVSGREKVQLQVREKRASDMVADSGSPSHMQRQSAELELTPVHSQAKREGSSAEEFRTLKRRQPTAEELAVLPDRKLNPFQRHSTDKFGNTILDLRGQPLQLKPAKISLTGAFGKQRSLQRNDPSIFQTTMRMRVLQQEGAAKTRSSKALPTATGSHPKVDPICVSQCRRPSQNSHSFGNNNTSFVIEGESLHHATAGQTNLLSKRYSLHQMVDEEVPAAQGQVNGNRAPTDRVPGVFLNGREDADPLLGAGNSGQATGVERARWAAALSMKQRERSREQEQMAATLIGFGGVRCNEGEGEGATGGPVMRSTVQKVPKGVRNVKILNKVNSNAILVPPSKTAKVAAAFQRAQPKDLESHVNNRNRQKYLNDVRNKQYLRSTQKFRNFYQRKANTFQPPARAEPTSKLAPIVGAEVWNDEKLTALCQDAELKLLNKESKMPEMPLHASENAYVEGQTRSRYQSDLAPGPSHLRHAATVEAAELRKRLPSKQMPMDPSHSVYETDMPETQKQSQLEAVASNTHRGSTTSYRDKNAVAAPAQPRPSDVDETTIGLAAQELQTLKSTDLRLTEGDGGTGVYSIFICQQNVPAAGFPAPPSEQLADAASPIPDPPSQQAPTQILSYSRTSKEAPPKNAQAYHSEQPVFAPLRSDSFNFFKQRAVSRQYLLSRKMLMQARKATKDQLPATTLRLQHGRSQFVVQRSRNDVPLRESATDERQRTFPNVNIKISPLMQKQLHEYARTMQRQQSHEEGRSGLASMRVDQRALSGQILNKQVMVEVKPECSTGFGRSSENPLKSIRTYLSKSGLRYAQGGEQQAAVGGRGAPPIKILNLSASQELAQGPGLSRTQAEKKEEARGQSQAQPKDGEAGPTSEVGPSVPSIRRRSGLPNSLPDNEWKTDFSERLPVNARAVLDACLDNVQRSAAASLDEKGMQRVKPADFRKPRRNSQLQLRLDDRALALPDLSQSQQSKDQDEAPYILKEKFEKECPSERNGAKATGQANSSQIELTLENRKSPESKAEGRTPKAPPDGDDPVFLKESVDSPGRDQALLPVTARNAALPSTALLSVQNNFGSEASPMRQQTTDTRPDQLANFKSALEIFQKERSQHLSGSSIQVELSQRRKDLIKSKDFAPGAQIFDPQAELQAVHEETLRALVDHGSATSGAAHEQAATILTSAKALSNNAKFIRVNHQLAQPVNVNSTGWPANTAMRGLSSSQENFAASQRRRQTSYLRKREKKTRKEIGQLLLKSKLRGAPPVIRHDAEGIALQQTLPAPFSGASLLDDSRPDDNGGVQYDKLMKTVSEYKAQHSQLKGDAFINSNVQINLKMTKLLRETLGVPTAALGTPEEAVASINQK